MTDRKAEKVKVREITDKLEEGLKELFESNQYRDYLTAMSKFHHYSYNNALLIALQKPDATLIAGYRAWQKNFNRNVKKGEKGIRILAPVVYRVETDDLYDDDKNNHNNELRVASFRTVTVFDISQTEGDPVPTLGVDELLSEVDGYNKLFDVIANIAPSPVSFEHITGMTKGYFSQSDNRIVLKYGMSESQTLKTLIHETAHAILHNNAKQTKDRSTKEVEAESVAYTVLQHFGIDTSEYSFGYIVGWSSDKSMKELKASLQTIQKTSSWMITAIEDNLAQSAKT